MAGEFFDDEGKKSNDPREIELLTISNLLKTENGRDFMWRCLQECGTFSDIFDADNVLQAYKSGQRRIGLWLESELKEASPDLYLMMLKEHLDE